MNAQDTVTEQVLSAMRQREKDFLERKRPGVIEATPEQIEYANNYWTRVFADKPPRQELMLSRSNRVEDEYEAARRKFWAVLQLRAAHISVIDNINFEWEFDENKKFIIQNLIKYFINDPSCAWPLNKGIFLYGMPGTGKTEMMMAAQRFCSDYGFTKAFELCSLSEIYTTAKANKEFDPVTPNSQGERCFDEFGRHTGAVIRFGDGLDINEAIIERRYERKRRYGQLTHFIANATPNELEGAFSQMVFDRLKSMCTSIHVTGQSKRK